MATTNLGKATIVPKGAYSASVEYSRLNAVTDGGNTYLYINATPTTGTALTSETHWLKIASKGADAVVDATLTQSGQAADAATVGSQLSGKAANAFADPSGNIEALTVPEALSELGAGVDGCTSQLAAIPDNYASALLTVSEDNPASISPVVGSQIDIDVASASLSSVNVIVVGKNLLNENAAKSASSYTTDTWSKYRLPTVAGETYTISRQGNTGLSNHYARINGYTSIVGATSKDLLNGTGICYQAITFVASGNDILEIYNGHTPATLAETWAVLVYLQLESGATATAHATYVGSTNTVTITGGVGSLTLTALSDDCITIDTDADTISILYNKQALIDANEKADDIAALDTRLDSVESVIVDTPFVTNVATLAGILNINVYDKGYSKYAISKFWHNSNGLAIYIRMQYWDGSAWQTLIGYESTTDYVEDVELLSVDGYFDVLVDWTKVAATLDYNTTTEIKHTKYNYTGYNPYALNAYAVKDDIAVQITVDAGGNGMYTTIGAAYAAITDSDIRNQYEVVVWPGVYKEFNLVPPKYTHTHGVQPNTVIVDGTDATGSSPTFELRDASSKLSNMKILAKVGYCLHFDTNLDGVTLLIENVHFVRSPAASVIGGGADSKGVIFHWKNCIFEGGEVACHQEINGDNVNTHLIFENCKLLNGAYLKLGTSGAFGHCVCDIKGLYTVPGEVSIKSWYAGLRSVDRPWSYFANNCMWQVLGGDNPYFLSEVASTGEGLEFESDNVGETITVSGTAVPYLFGLVNYKQGGARCKARAMGIYHVKDEQSGTVPYSVPADVVQMWKRLGDCSVTNKTLSVTIGATTETYTFDQDYLTAKTAEADLLTAVNTAITIATLKKNLVTDAWENLNVPEIQFVTVADAGDVLKGEWITVDGNRCTAESAPYQVYGIALESGIVGDQIRVWVGDVFKITAADGEYGMAADGILSSSATVKIGRIKSNILYRY